MRYVLLLALLQALPVAGQPFHLDTPADSPLWWTLTDDLTATELQAALTDQQGHIDRYQAALAAGRVERRVDPSQLPGIYYVDARLTPELVPLWYAFDKFANRLRFRSPEELAEPLATAGLTAAGREAVLAVASRQMLQPPILAARLDEDFQVFLEILRRIQAGWDGSEADRRALRQALNDRDLAYFEDHSELSIEELAPLYDAWHTVPAAEVAQETLPTLRAQLSERDWQRLRGFLLREIAPSFKDLLMVDELIGSPLPTTHR